MDLVQIDYYCLPTPEMSIVVNHPEVAAPCWMVEEFGRICLFGGTATATSQ